eukprot:159476-Chlamydomonas_euryale.AAC.1
MEFAYACLRLAGARGKWCARAAAWPIRACALSVPAPRPVCARRAGALGRCVSWDGESGAGSVASKQRFADAPPAKIHVRWNRQRAHGINTRRPRRLRRTRLSPCKRASCRAVPQLRMPAHVQRCFTVAQDRRARRCWGAA